MGTIFKFFRRQLKGTNTGNVYINPPDSGIIALAFVHAQGPSGSMTETNLSRSGTVNIGGRSMSLNLALGMTTGSSSSRTLTPICLKGAILPGESLSISSSTPVQWEIIELSQRGGL